MIRVSFDFAFKVTQFLDIIGYWYGKLRAYRSVYWHRSGYIIATRKVLRYRKRITYDALDFEWNGFFCGFFSISLY